MAEKYSVWQPSVDLQSSYVLERLDDVVDGFYVTLWDQEDKNKKIRITFQNSIHAHQLFIDQDIVSYRKSCIRESHSLFFTVQDSFYIKWLYEQSYEIWQDTADIHFVIVLSDVIIDIFATEEPCIEIIKHVE